MDAKLGVEIGDDSWQLRHTNNTTKTQQIF